MAALKKDKRKCMNKVCGAYLIAKDEKEKGICSFCTLGGVTKANLKKSKGSVPEEVVRKPKAKKRKRRPV